MGAAARATSAHGPALARRLRLVESGAEVRPSGRATVEDGAEIEALYLHIPFCERKCEYCDFASVGGVRGAAAYVAALRSEIRMLAGAAPGVRLATVFVGGGTPSLVDPALLRDVIGDVRAAFTVAAEAEITLEANPSSTTEARAEAWLAAGFTRVSVGVQSLEDDVLAFLGRVHDPAGALAALDAVRRAGFVHVNADLIYAVPGLDDRRWRTTLERVLEADPGHLSCYELTVEPGTPLAGSVARGEADMPDAGAALRQHWVAIDAAERAGYRQYEVSNLARPGRECRHNLVYWRNRCYLAAGVGAHGHVPAGVARALGIACQPDGRVRFWHAPGIGHYRRALERGLLPLAGWEQLGHADVEAEGVLLGLRLREGVILPSRAVPAAARLAGAGLLTLQGARAITTARGEEVLDEVIARLLA